MSNNMFEGTHEDFFYPDERYQETLPDIINAFVSFYGEKFREEITKRFHNTLTIFSRSTSDKKRLISQKHRELSEILQREFLKNIGMEDTEENMKALFDNNSFDYMPLMPILESINYLDDPDSYNTKRQFNVLLTWFYKKTIELITDEEILKFKSLLTSYIPFAQKMILDFNSYKDSHKDFIEQTDASEKEINEYNFNLEIEYLESISQFLTEEDKIKITKMKKDHLFFNTYGLSIYPRLISGSFSYSALIDSFSSDNEEILRVNPITHWKCQSIISDRIKYFKASGLDLGDDYNSYMSLSDIKKYIPSSLWVDDFIKNRKFFEDKKTIFYITSTSDYKRNIQRIKESQFISTSHDYTVANINASSTFVSPCVSKKSGELEIVPIMHVSLSSCVDSIDHYIFHELNHLVELSMIDVDEKECSFICGWDPLKSTIEKEETENTEVEYSHEIRPYEKLNEIINELIAQDIHTIFLENGNRIFTDADKTKIRFTTSYEYAFFMVKDFYYTFKQKIIESRRSGNIDVITEVVGKENFERLNFLVDLLGKEFAGFEIYSTLEKMKNGIEDEKTTLFMQIKEESKTLFEKMLEHSLSKTLE